MFSKCKLCLRSVAFLKHMVSKEGINVDLSNIESIHYCYMPTSITKVYSFIGLASYFIRFVEVFSTIAVPLNFFSQGCYLCVVRGE